MQLIWYGLGCRTCLLLVPKVLPVILVIKENWLPLMNLMCMKFYFKLHHEYP